ncbi:MAG: F-type H+-transporting ATPase subunit gamma [Planctomycetota bacterium]|jgi:F-type H+-transporting ATPase subunit gamma
MAGIKELRVRIKSVGSIKQITRAMEMVATTKLRRFQDRATSSRPYATEISGLVGRLAAVLGEDGVQGMPLFNVGAGDKTLALVVTSDRGLCGAYNSNLLKLVESWRAEQSNDVEYYIYGRKGAQYMGARDFSVKGLLTDPPLESMDYRNAATTSRMLQKAFLSGEYKDVVIFFSAFETMAKYVPTVLPFLPLSGVDSGGEEGSAAGADVLLEPDAATIFEHLVPRYLETRIYNALLESLTSEYASRRFAMKNATEAANDMQKALRGVYNRKRQENITKELLDIVGGAEAVK